MTARLVIQDDHAPSLLADFEGNVQQLPNYDDFVGWGQQPWFSQYDQRGRLVLDGRFVGGTSSYRAYRFRWTGTPPTIPAIAAGRSGADTIVYASWNGDTAVTAWRVLSGASSGALRPTRTDVKTGFETAITISAARFVRVQALDSRGHVIGTSLTVPAG